MKINLFRFSINQICFLIISILSFSCHKCEQNKIADLTFTEEERATNPYFGGDTLIFKGQTGDSVLYAFESREVWQNKYFEIGPEEAKLYHDDCQGDFLIVDKDETVLWTPDSISGISIILAFEYSFQRPTSAKSIKLNLSSKEDYNGYFKYYFEKDTIIKADSGQILNYYPVKQIGPVIYYDVYELINHSIPQFAIQIAYYSVKDGLVGFELTSGEVYYLVNGKL